MSRIEERIAEAQAMLRLFGMDRARTNVRSACILLSLLGLRPEQAWSDAEDPLRGTRAIMDWIRDHYGFDYKPNSRETVRRETLHQFVEAHLALLNPDNPARPVNSPDSAYQITDEALAVIRLYGMPEFADVLARYLAERPGLKVLWAVEREMDRIPLVLPGGREFSLTPGGQNVLMKQIVEDFCPRFTPGGEVLYIGDAGDKWALFEPDRLAGLGASVDEHGKMPDLVVYMPDRNWLVLMEAASSQPGGFQALQRVVRSIRRYNCRARLRLVLPRPR